MKVKLFIHKNHNLSVPDLVYGPDGKFHESGKFIDVKDDNGNLVYENKSATASFVEGEEIPAEYLNGDYVQKEEEINDEEITNRLSTFKAEGYRGDFASMAKLMAMGMDTMAVTRALPSILPTTNLQYNDIRDVLNFNGGAVGNNMASLFKESAKINHMAKYKPSYIGAVLFTRDNPGTFVVDIASRPSLSIKDYWWIGKNGQCNINIPEIVSIEDNAPDEESWSYIPIEGGEQSPYRLGDFAGYNSEATGDIVGLQCPTKVVIGKEFSVWFQKKEVSDTNLSLDDVFHVVGAPTMVLRIWRLNHPSSYKLKEFQPTSSNQKIDFTLQDLALGAEVGNYYGIHLCAKNAIGRYVSMKVYPEMQTFFKIKISSSEPYGFISPLGTILRDLTDTYQFQLWNIKFGITANGYTGGTLPSGSRLVMYNNVGTSANYPAERELWSSEKAGAITVSGTETKYFPISERENIRLGDPPQPFRSAVIIWYDNANQELSRGYFTIQSTDIETYNLNK